MVQFLLGGGPGPAKQICAANPPTDLPATGTELAAQDTTTQPRALASAHLPKFASPTASNFWMPPHIRSSPAPARAVMSEAHHLISNASYDPDTLNMLREVLDEVWASILNGFGNDFREVEAAHIQLATIVLDLARDGQLGQLQITRTAARLTREKHAHTNQRC
jgi:hypothetical protein